MHYKAFLPIGLVLILLLTSCSILQLPGGGQVTEKAPVSNQLTQATLQVKTVSASATLFPNFTPLPTDTPQPTLTPTPAQTATPTTPPEPSFDPANVVDITSLDSYQLFSKSRQIYTKKDSQTTSRFSDLSVEYQKNPKMYFATNVLGSQLDPNGKIVSTGTDDYYWAGNFFYDYYHDSKVKNWFVRAISAKSNQKDVEYFLLSYGFGNAISSLKTAHFAGKEVTNNIPAFHFTFNENDLGPDSRLGVTWKNRHVEGNLYLSQEGNYPVHYDAKSSADVESFLPEVQEFWGDIAHLESEEVIDLVSVNQGNGISLPAEAPRTDKVVDAPLPPEAEFSDIMDTGNAVTYIYTTPKTVQETMDYYQNLAYPAGWQLGQVISDNPNHAQVNLFKGKDLRILYIHFNKYSGWTEIEVNFFQ